jgi:hypothetical protein
LPPQAVQDGGRLAWGSGPPGEAPRYTGLDVIVVRDGKIAALYVFLDAPGWSMVRAQVDHEPSDTVADNRQ